MLGGIILGFFAVGLFVGRALYHVPGIGFKQIREGAYNQGKYEFINPLLGCEVAEQKEVSEFMPLKNKILNLIKEKTSQGDATAISVYFDRRDGRWLSVNGREKYFPASLMKVPTMMAFFKLAETHPEILQKSVVYQSASDLNQIEYFKSEKTLEVNRRYTIEELIERMIVYSDNNTLPLLLNNIDENAFEDVFTDLGLKLPKDNKEDLNDYIIVKSYANFFRVLYNASYLTRTMSEKALKLLSKPYFKQGLMAGVPDTITVAKKFGERSFSDRSDNPNSIKELHDCGIVYYPEHPYLLCVMTKGKDFKKLAKSIADISRLVYETVDSEVMKKP